MVTPLAFFHSFLDYSKYTSMYIYHLLASQTLEDIFNSVAILYTVKRK